MTGLGGLAQASRIDISFSEFLQFLHVASAFVFVTGLIGRDLILGRARRTEDLARVRTFLDASRPFEVMVVRTSPIVLILGALTWWAEKLPLWAEGTRWVPISFLLFASALPLVPLVFLPRGRVFESALAVAIEQDRLTPELAAAFRDPAVAAARWYELAMVSVVLLVMVTKPF